MFTQPDPTTGFMKIDSNHLELIADDKMRQQVERLDFLSQDPNMVQPPRLEDRQIDVRLIPINTHMEACMRDGECIGIRRL